MARGHPFDKGGLNIMRFSITRLVMPAALLLTACDFWPDNLEPLAQAISQQVSGETTAWLVSGDVVVIDVAGSSHYQDAQPALEDLATDIAGQAITFTTVPLESIVVTFHAREVSDDPQQQRDFIFLVQEGRPVLQPAFDFDATGPLGAEELNAALGRLGDAVSEAQKHCAREAMDRLAVAAGDPQTLDPAEVEYLSAETWGPLDAFGKRLILAQAIMTKALLNCAGQ